MGIELKLFWKEVKEMILFKIFFVSSFDKEKIFLEIKNISLFFEKFCYICYKIYAH